MLYMHIRQSAAVTIRVISVDVQTRVLLRFSVHTVPHIPSGACSMTSPATLLSSHTFDVATRSRSFLRSSFFTVRSAFLSPTSYHCHCSRVVFCCISIFAAFFDDSVAVCSHEWMAASFLLFSTWRPHAAEATIAILERALLLGKRRV